MVVAQSQGIANQLIPPITYPGRACAGEACGEKRSECFRYFTKAHLAPITSFVYVSTTAYRDSLVPVPFRSSNLVLPDILGR